MTPADRLDDTPRAAALAAMDRVLAKRPENDGHCFSEATRCLCELRDHFIHRLRNGEDLPRQQEKLTAVNAVISAVLAGHFPLGTVPWDEIETARQWIGRL